MFKVNMKEHLQCILVPQWKTVKMLLFSENWLDGEKLVFYRRIDSSCHFWWGFLIGKLSVSVY